MDSSTPTSPEITPENDDLSPDLLQDEEELSSGNSRLALILGGIVAVLLVGYLLLPATITHSAGAPELPTPTMELGEATITGARSAEEEAPAAAAEAEASAVVAKPTPITARPVAAARAAAAAAPAPDEVEELAPAPVVAAAPVAAEPVAVAPTTLKMNGRVLDEEGRPLAGATIMLKGSKMATSTDANGNYSLDVPTGTDNTLLYGYGGYEDQLLRSRNAKTQIVTLLPKEGAKRRRR